MRLCSTGTAAPRCSVGTRYRCRRPERGQLQLRHTAIGVNFIDIYDRSGLYPRALPETPGREAAGVVIALGPECVGSSAANAWPMSRRPPEPTASGAILPPISGRTAAGNQRRAGGGADAQGPDRRISAAPYLSGESWRLSADPRRGRRRRLAAHAVGAAAGREGHGYRRHRG